MHATKIIILIFAVLLMGNALAFTPATIPNYKNYEIINISNSSFVYSVANPTNTLATLSLPVNYTYLQYSQINSTAAAEYPYILFAGYQNGIFAGNITTYPFHDGIIINRTTSFNKTYNTIVIYYNQFNKQAETNDKISIYQNNLSYGSRLIAYGLNLTSLSPKYISSNLTEQQFDWNNLQIPYFFVSAGSNANATLYYYPTLTFDISNKLAYYSYYNNIQRITLGDTFTSPSVSAPANSIYLYISSGAPYTFVANGIMLSQNATSISPTEQWNAYNSTSQTGYTTGLFYSPYKYNLELRSPAPANTIVNYYLVPAFANISITNNVANVIVNPIRPKLNVSLQWNYELPITNINWTYKFNTTKLDNGAQQFTYTNSSVKYLLLTMPAYKQFGNLAIPQVKAYTNVAGVNYTMPISVLDYNNSDITFVIEQNATAGAVKNFTLLLNNTLGDSFTSSIQFELIYNGSGSIPNTTIYSYPIVQLNKIPASSSYINFRFVGTTSGGGLGNTQFYISYPTVNKETIKATTYNYNGQVNNNELNSTASENMIFESVPILQTYEFIGIGQLYGVNDAVSFSQYTATLAGSINYNLSLGVNLTLQKAYTTNYILGNIQPISTTSTTTNTTRPIITTTIAYNTTGVKHILNSSMPFLTANGTLITNTSVIATLTTNSTILHGLSVPTSVSVITLVLVILGLFFVLKYDNPIVVIVYLLGVWLIDITDFTFVIFSFVITAIVLANELIVKRSKNGA